MKIKNVTKIILTDPDLSDKGICSREIIIKTPNRTFLIVIESNSNDDAIAVVRSGHENQWM